MVPPIRSPMEWALGIGGAHPLSAAVRVGHARRRCLFNPDFRIPKMRTQPPRSWFLALNLLTEFEYPDR
jgi:hypothetical protein